MKFKHRRAVYVFFAVQWFVAGFAAWQFWGMDIWCAMSFEQPFYLLLTAIMTGLLMSGVIRIPGLFVLAAPFAFLAFSITLPFLNNSSLKPLFWKRQELQGFMTELDCIRLLSDASTQHGWPTPIVEAADLESDGVAYRKLSFRPQGRHPGFSAESFDVIFQNQEIVKTEFVAD